MKKQPCIICDEETEYYFSKDQYLSHSLVKFTSSLVPVKFYKCPKCGFVISKTHQELSPQDWQDLNNAFHHYNEKCDRQILGFNQPPYAEQAFMIELLIRNHIIDGSYILDYAAGYGTLGHILHTYYSRQINCYDKYIQNAGSGYVKEPVKKGASVVINSAMFEHIINREDLDAVNELVSDTGALFIHTVVVDKVPNDPNWFYIDIPVHTAVHTNRSMAMLMKQWGFHSSIYSPKSKSWVLLRQNYDQINSKVERINQELQTQWLFGKQGFMDYWKN